MTAKSPTLSLNRQTLTGITIAALVIALLDFNGIFFSDGATLETAIDRSWKRALGIWIGLALGCLIYPKLAGLARPGFAYAVACAISFAIVEFVRDTLFDAGTRSPFAPPVHGAITGMVWGLVMGWLITKAQVGDEANGDASTAE